MNELDSAHQHNQQVWDHIARNGDRFYRAATDDQIRRARDGDVQIQLTPIRYAPRHWLGELAGRRVLGLACGGGLQGPLLAAAGAEVTVLDFSSEQLLRDSNVAEQHALELDTIQSDMTDLSAFTDATFDLIINPCSVCFCPDVGPIWAEVARVLKPGGTFITGFIKPINYLFDAQALEQRNFQVRHKIPYRDTALPDDEQRLILSDLRAAEFGHSLTQLLGMQMDAGMAMIGYYEDRWGNSDLLSDYIDVFAATRSLKTASS